MFGKGPEPFRGISNQVTRKILHVRLLDKMVRRPVTDSDREGWLAQLDEEETRLSLTSHELEVMAPYLRLEE